MRDAISLKRIDTLHPAIRQEVKETIEEVEKDFPAGPMVRVTDALRTFEEQTALYAKGRSAPGPRVTNARAGSSFHNYGLAFDGVIIDKGKAVYDHLLWKKVVDAFKKKGWTWGGDWLSFKDRPHLEKMFGYKITDLLKLVRGNNVIPGTRYPKI